MVLFRRHSAGIHVPFSDVFHTLKGIIPIAVEADKGRFVMPVDFLWMKLGDNNGIPVNDFGQASINTHLTESILTSGDAGAGGANLDYQVLGTLNFKFTQHLGVGLGWRYLYENYRPSNHQFVYNTATSGALAGFYYTFGGKPPVPVSAACSASPAEVWSGDSVTVTANGAN